MTLSKNKLAVTLALAIAGGTTGCAQTQSQPKTASVSAYKGSVYIARLETAEQTTVTMECSKAGGHPVKESFSLPANFYLQDDEKKGQYHLSVVSDIGETPTLDGSIRTCELFGVASQTFVSIKTDLLDLDGIPLEAIKISLGHFNKSAATISLNLPGQPRNRIPVGSGLASDVVMPIAKAPTNIFAI